MIQETEPTFDPTSRIGAARKSLIASIIFLIATVVILTSNGLAMSSWSNQFFKANPDHPLTVIVGLIFEVTFLGLPFNFLASLIVILAGVRGLKHASRTKEGVGRSESMTGIGLSILVMFLSVVGVFQWGSAFRQ